MFHDLPLPANIGVFATAAATVWFAGTRLAGYADAIAEKTGIGREFLGILLLGGITSLPEIAVATTATLQGTPILSVNDVLGSAAVNLVILAVADATTGRGALTSMQGSPLVMLQGVLGIMLMAVVYLGAIGLLARSQSERAWKPSRRQPNPDVGGKEEGDGGELRPLGGKTAAAGFFILWAGFLLARTGETIADQSGLGSSFFGAVFLGFSTSLPEISTVIAAVRLKRYEMAISDIFGTNLFNVLILFLVDALHSGGSVLVEAGPFAAFGALLALMLTAVFLVGLIERRDRTVMHMGIDSLAAIGIYCVGVAVFYHLR